MTVVTGLWANLMIVIRQCPVTQLIHGAGVIIHGLADAVNNPRDRIGEIFQPVGGVIPILGQQL